MPTSTKYIYAIVNVEGSILEYAASRSDARIIKQDAEYLSHYKDLGFKQPFKIVRYSNPEVIR